MQLYWSSLALVIFLALASGCGQRNRSDLAPPPDPRERSADAVRLEYPNILFITVETLRADHLGCYGYERETSPSIDALAQEGALFEQAFVSKGSTWPALATLHTSLWPVSHGVRYNGMRLTDDPDALAEVLKSNAYTCAAFITNGGRQNFEGFDQKSIYDEEPRDALATRDVRQWLRQNATTRFFIWVHYFSPHGPYEPPEANRRFTDSAYSGTLDGSYDRLKKVFENQEDLAAPDLQHIINLYDDEVALTDGMVGMLVHNLKELNLYENTLIVFSADHGEELYDHHRYFHHQGSVYDSVLHVPLIFRFPETIPAGRRFTALVNAIDVAPTILDLAGISVPKSYQGRSLTPHFRGESVDPGPVYGEWGDKILTLRTKEYKLIWNPLGFRPPVVREKDQAGGLVQADINHLLPLSTVELYRIQDDPGERNNVSAEYPSVVESLHAELEKFRKEFHWQLDDALIKQRLKDEIDEETRQELENLGYVL